MRKLIIIASLVGSLIIYCLSINLFDSLLMFLLFGILPDRAQPVPAGPMLSAYIVLETAIIAFILRAHIIRAYSLKPQLKLAVPSALASLKIRRERA